MGATSGQAREQSPARLIDQPIKDLRDWRDKTLANDIHEDASSTRLRKASGSQAS